MTTTTESPVEIVQQWFEQNRGIHPETLDHFGVEYEWDGADALAVFPYPNGNRKTRSGFLGDRRFSFTPGATPGLFHVEDADKHTVFLCEGETDAMRLWQEMSPKARESFGVIAIGGIHTWRPEMAKEITAKRAYVILDNDPDYNVQAKVDDVWRQIRHDLGARARRVSLPTGVKDLCEFFQTYPLELLVKLAAATVSVSRFQPLDLAKKPPPPNWLLDGWVAMGDLTLTSGGANLGKSWLTMGLAVAVADGHKTFCGLPLYNVPGKVLYVDEENPEDVVYSRLSRLGLKNLGNLRYLWNNGVRMDRHPEELLDEALDFEPSLIVLDAFTRLHTKEENQSGDMAGLFNDAIKPLARETGAAVLLIHHHDKSGSSPRGSSDIIASPDAALDVWRAGHGQFRMRITKSRRRLTGDELVVRITDQPDGTVALVPMAGVGIPDMLDDVM